MEKVWPKVNLPEVVTHLAIRYLYTVREEGGMGYGDGMCVGVGGTSD